MITACPAVNTEIFALVNYLLLKVTSVKIKNMTLSYVSTCIENILLPLSIQTLNKINKHANIRIYS